MFIVSISFVCLFPFSSIITLLTGSWNTDCLGARTGWSKKRYPRFILATTNIHRLTEVIAKIKLGDHFLDHPVHVLS